jgi:hypothetical protein
MLAQQLSVRCGAWHALPPVPRMAAYGGAHGADALARAQARAAPAAGGARCVRRSERIMLALAKQRTCSTRRERVLLKKLGCGGPRAQRRVAARTL